MRPVSLLVLAHGFKSVPQALMAAFEAQLSEREEPLPSVKEHEADSLVRLVEDLAAHGITRPSLYEGFVFSFRIPQIGTEFDLLKIGADAVVNIELKSEDVGRERIREQLERTRHYLGPLGRTIRTLTYVSDSRQLLELCPGGRLERRSMQELGEALAAAGAPYAGIVEELFKASNYLVSPLNDTDKFLEGRYFLTNHQAQIKASYLAACADRSEPTVFLVYGSAGTGKTLLLYDLACAVGKRAGRPACVVHCGQLTERHRTLDEREGALRIVSAKDLFELDPQAFSALLVDEAQRLWPSQTRHLVRSAHAAQVPLYLSLDRRQTLGLTEEGPSAEELVRASFDQPRVWELSRRIRTNRDLVYFIRAFCGLRGAERYTHTSHVKLGCARGAEDARAIVQAFRDEGYQYIALHPESQRAFDELAIPGCPSAAMVIGQEFNKVVMALGPHVSPDDPNQRQLLYQGLTRARSDIALVVYDNNPLMERLLRML